METLTYTDPKGQPQVFNVGDEVFITDIGDRPKYGKISKWQQWWYVNSRGIEVKDLESGKYELEHMEPRPILTPEQIEENNKKYMTSRNEDHQEFLSQKAGRSRRKSKKSRKSRKSRKYRR